MKIGLFASPADYHHRVQLCSGLAWRKQGAGEQLKWQVTSQLKKLLHFKGQGNKSGEGEKRGGRFGEGKIPPVRK